MTLPDNLLDIVLKRARRIESDERRDVFFNVVAAELKRAAFIDQKSVRKAVEFGNRALKEGC